MRKHLTTTQAARLAYVSPNIIVAHFDSGALAGFRVPASRHRRIPCESLLKFLVENGVPTDLFFAAFPEISVGSAAKS